MDRDKITVKDALVSTDVDRLIKTISERKKVGLGELERTCGMDRRSVEKWIRVLEDEGYISISYGLTGTSVSWLGADTMPVQDADAGDIDAVLARMPSDVVTNSSDAEKRLEDYLRKKRGDDDDAFEEEDSLKANILGRLGEDKKDNVNTPYPLPTRSDGNDEPSEDSEKDDSVNQGSARISDTDTPEEDEPPAPENADEADEEEEKPRPIAIEPDEPAAPEPPRRITDDSRSRQVKEIVNSYINQISREKAELGKLKAEKERVYRERYLALESKVEADISTITEKMLEKEGRILELKERVLGLPEKVGQVEEIHRSVRMLERDGKEALVIARTEVEEFLAQTAKDKESILAKLEGGRSVLEEEGERVHTLEALSETVDSSIEDIRKAAAAAKKQVEELDSRMKAMLIDLEDAAEMKAEVAEMTAQVRSSIEEKNAEFDSLEKRIKGIEKTERSVREYVSDYEKKLGDIAEFVQSGEDEISKVRKSAESASLQKYLRELDELTSVYDSAISEAAIDEKTIGEKIEQSKSRLSTLLRDSKDMIKKMRVDTPDFEEGRQALSKRSDNVLQILGEKEDERERLLEDLKDAKKGSSRQGAPSRARPRASSKRRKNVVNKRRKPANKSRRR